MTTKDYTGPFSVILGNMKKRKGVWREHLACIGVTVYGEKHSARTLFETLSNLGIVQLQLGQYEEACFERALAVNESANDEKHLTLGIALSNFGNLLLDLGQCKEAKNICERVLAVDEDAYDKKQPELADSLSNLGRVLFDLGQYEESKSYFARVLVINA
jgi:tetratricopeptide (TPR) repeat protein